MLLDYLFGPPKVMSVELIDGTEKMIQMLLNKLNDQQDLIHTLFNRISTLEERLSELESG